MSSVEQYLPPPLRGMPAEDWRWIGAALLGVSGLGMWALGYRIHKSAAAVGDPDCSLESYIAFLGDEKTAERAWRYAGEVKRTADYFGVPANLLMGLIHTESRFSPTAGSSAGAVGLTQFMPTTAVARYRKLVEQGEWPFESLVTYTYKWTKQGDEWWRWHYERVKVITNNDPQATTLFRDEGVEDFLDRTNPQQAIWLGGAGLRSKFEGGWDLDHALASYNAGSARVHRDTPSSEWPQETQNYVPAVKKRMNRYADLWEQCAS